MRTDSTSFPDPTTKLATRWTKIAILVLVLVPSAPLAAQDPSPADALPGDVPPPNFAAAELARSRDCVPALARLEAVASEFDPRRRRAQRLEALHRAVSVEDSLRVSPLAEDDPLERAVSEWFAADTDLAVRYLETGDEEIRERRQTRREAMLDRLRQAYEDVSREAAEILESAEGLDRAVRDCEGRILVRSAVLEACETTSSPVCEVARTEEPSGQLNFVEDAGDLWDIERLRPWSEPSRLQLTPDGRLGGARSASLARRGNITLVVSLEALIQPRDSLSQEQLSEFDAHLDSLGFDFDHPDLIMAPALTFELDVPGTLGAETDYVLHFGDLSDPEADILWTGPVPETWPLRAVFAARESSLVRLARGEPLSVSAVRLSEGENPESPSLQDEVIFTLGLTPVGQASTIISLLQYMGGGGFAADLAALIPPEASEPR